MELSDIEKERWAEHLRLRVKPTFPKEKELKIVEMTASGYSIKDIHNELRCSIEKIGETRRRARKQGLI